MHDIRETASFHDIAVAEPADFDREVQPATPELANTRQTSPPPTQPPPAPPVRERVGYDKDTSLKLYLREIGKVKLLTPEEEIELAARIKNGDKKAREEMIKANLRLVVKIARDYEGIGLPLLDMISEGNIGLMRAVERFDPTKGAKLSTYAAWWIKQSIKRGLANQSKTIRLPVHILDKLSRINQAARRLHQELGREATDEELGDELGLSGSSVAQMRSIAVRPASLDAPLGDEESNTFGEVVQDENAETPFERLAEKAASGALREMLDTLSQREGEILRARFGFDGGSEQTLEQVSEALGVTRERVRQIQNNALRKLRQMLGRLEPAEAQN